MHTTFKVGGPAEIYAEPESPAEAGRIIRQAAEESRRVLVLGSGSNILVSDKGFSGLVVATRRLNRISVSGSSIFAESGVSLAVLLNLAVRQGLAGFEFLAGIPGTVGGALLMNAGTADQAISEKTGTVAVLDRGFNELTLDSGRVKSGYRFSSLSDYSLILSAVLNGSPGQPRDIKCRIAEIMRQRLAKQPYGCPSAGSVFKNPDGDAAGRLIEQAGCKGWQCGGAIVSEKHANFILNAGKASAADIRRLMERVRQAVLAQFGVALEPEVKIIGFD